MRWRRDFRFFFFFQAEDGIRDVAVTGVQTCALPIWRALHRGEVPEAPGATDGRARPVRRQPAGESEEHTSELQSRLHLVCRLLLEKKKKTKITLFFVKCARKYATSQRLPGQHQVECARRP